MNDPIQKIKDRLDIVDVVKSYIKLEKAGANYRALCPFHNEKTPSFFVSPSRQIWHCFGACDEGGDMFKFVMKIEGVEFGDALRILAQKAGVELKRQDPKLKTARKRMYEICDLACNFFEKQLDSSKGKKVKKYLNKRGINNESVEKWRLGYSPDQWDSLINFLTKKDYKKKEIVKAGLAIQKEDGKTFDRFRGRIMFPIFDLNSQVIGFGGRVFEEKKTAKYVNTPNTLLYDKSRILYGLNEAKVPIRKKDNCILVEGYTDVILASQAGFKNVVASSGTALTNRHLKILKRYSNNLLCAFDMDVAGSSATKRGINLAQRQGFKVKVIKMPQGSDPADIIAKDSKKWKKLVKEAISIIEFYFDNAFSQFDKETAEGKEKISKVVLPAIKRIPNEITKAHWIQELSKRLGVDEESVNSELRKFSLEKEEVEEKKEKKEKSREELLQERTLALILKEPQHLRLIKDEHFSFFNSPAKEILKKCKKNLKGNSLAQLTKELSSKEQQFLDYLGLKSDLMEEEDIEVEIKTCLKEMKHSQVKKELNHLSKEIKKAEQENNEKKVKTLLNKFSKKSQELNQ